jgi:hypothetical protein
MIDLRTKTCCQKLNISTSSFQEIKYRLGYREKITIEQFNEIEKIVEDIKNRYIQVTMATVNRYWEYVRKEVQEDE